MGPAEIFHRLREALAKQSARRYNLGWDKINTSGTLRPLINLNLVFPPDLTVLLAAESERIRTAPLQLLVQSGPSRKRYRFPLFSGTLIQKTEVRSRSDIRIASISHFATVLIQRR